MRLRRINYYAADTGGIAPELVWSRAIKGVKWTSNAGAPTIQLPISRRSLKFVPVSVVEFPAIYVEPRRFSVAYRVAFDDQPVGEAEGPTVVAHEGRLNHAPIRIVQCRTDLHNGLPVLFDSPPPGQGGYRARDRQRLHDDSGGRIPHPIASLIVENFAVGFTGYNLLIPDDRKFLRIRILDVPQGLNSSVS